MRARPSVRPCGIDTPRVRGSVDIHGRSSDEIRRAGRFTVGRRERGRERELDQVSRLFRDARVKLLFPASLHARREREREKRERKRCARHAIRPRDSGLRWCIFDRCGSGGGGRSSMKTGSALRGSRIFAKFRHARVVRDLIAIAD